MSPIRSRPFAWWNTPAQRAHRAPSPTVIGPAVRRPFARPQPEPVRASQSAEIIPFTGSNTPYESHE